MLTGAREEIASAPIGADNLLGEEPGWLPGRDSSTLKEFGLGHGEAKGLHNRCSLKNSE